MVRSNIPKTKNFHNLKFPINISKCYITLNVNTKSNIEKSVYKEYYLNAYLRIYYYPNY